MSFAFSGLRQVMARILTQERSNCIGSGWRQIEKAVVQLGKLSQRERAGPSGAKARIFGAASGTAKQAAEKVEMPTSAPKGAINSKQLAASLKRCPDTKPNFSGSCKAVPFSQNHSCPFTKP